MNSVGEDTSPIHEMSECWATEMAQSFSPWDPHDKRRKQTLPSCPLTSMCALW